MFKRGTFPLYHTSYETYDLYSKLVDPGFKVNETIEENYKQTQLIKF
jgi:hypothetical protein